MPNLTQSDLKNVLAFTQELRSPCSLEDFSTRILSNIPKVISSELTFYSSLNLQSQALISAQTFPLLDPVEIERIKQVAHQYFYTHPMVSNFAQTRDGTARAISDFISPSQLYRLEGVYEQFLRPLEAEDQMGIVLPIASNNAVDWHLRHVKEIKCIAISRNQRNFSDRDRLVFNLLRPHILQAYQNSRVFTQMQQELIQLNRAMDQLGAIILTLDGQVQLMTQRASQLLTQYFQPLFLRTRSLPEDLQHWANYQISLLTQSSEIYPPSLPLRLEQEGKQLVIRFICDRPQNQYLLLLEEQTIRPLSIELLELLGLTRREAEVLFWVVKDKNNAEIATLLSCSAGTVKKHLEHIYSKLGVQTRVAAAMQALQKLGVLNQQ
jgi:DNA-binding CsgD family transcriptional regulator